MEMKTLHLTLKEEWFKMILRGIKKEEYREIKPYWDVRLEGRNYDVIKFTWGYGGDKPYMIVKCNGIYKDGVGNPDWGWDGPCYIIKLGKIIESGNIDDK